MPRKSEKSKELDALRKKSKTRIENIREKAREIQQERELTFADACRLVACEPNVQKLTEMVDKGLDIDVPLTIKNLRGIEKCLFEHPIDAAPRVKISVAMYVSNKDMVWRDVENNINKYGEGILRVHTRKGTPTPPRNIRRIIETCDEYIAYPEYEEYERTIRSTVRSTSFGKPFFKDLPEWDLPKPKRSRNKEDDIDFI